MGDLSNSLTGSVLSAPQSATPAAGGEDFEALLDRLFGQLDEQARKRSDENMAALSTMGQGGQAAVQQLQPPTPAPVPQTMSGPARAIATFGAGMGSSLTRNPGMLANMQQQIGAQDERTQRVEERNYAQQVAFDREKQGMLLSQQLKLLEMKAEEQIKSGDRDGALATLKAQTVLAERLRKEHDATALAKQKELLAEKLKNALTLVGARGSEARKTQEAKDKALTGGFDKTQLAEFGQRATALRDATTKQLTDLQTMQGGVGLNSEDGMARADMLQAQLDADLRNLAAEIRLRSVPTTPASTAPAPAPAPGANDNDPIRAAYLRRQGAKK